MHLFPKPADLENIYWDPNCNEKASMFGSGVLGPPHLFTICDAKEHRVMRKALGGLNVRYSPFGLDMSLTDIEVVDELSEEQLGRQNLQSNLAFHTQYD